MCRLEKEYILAWYDNPVSNGLIAGIRHRIKSAKKANSYDVYLLPCLSAYYKQLVPLFTDICKQFSCISKLIHALLASKRCPIGLQKMPF